MVVLWIQCYPQNASQNASKKTAPKLLGIPRPSIILPRPCNFCRSIQTNKQTNKQTNTVLTWWLNVPCHVLVGTDKSVLSSLLVEHVMLYQTSTSFALAGTFSYSSFCLTDIRICWNGKRHIQNVKIDSKQQACRWHAHFLWRLNVFSVSKGKHVLHSTVYHFFPILCSCYR